MNILILGLGSIGQRHLRNLHSINKNFNFFVLRKKFITPSLNNKNLVVKQDIKKKYKLKYLKNLSQIKSLSLKIDAAFICTPSKYHVDEAIWLIKNNINVFVEKPLGSNLKNINSLKNLILKKKKIVHMMGYQLKFNPIINKVKEILDKNSIGQIYNIFVHHGEHINDFHPYEDYRISYAARKDLGGGVILCQIHELDYILYLFPNYKLKILNSFNQKISDLKINVEDTLVANLSLKKNNKDTLCSIHLNFFEKPKNRKILMIGKDGKIEADLNTGIIELFKRKEKKIFKFKFDRNKIFKKQIEYFISCVKNKKRVDKKFDLLNGINSLKLALRLKNEKK